MKSFKIGGPKSFSSPRSPQAEAPRPSTPTAPSSKPGASTTPGAPKDGFDTVGSRISSSVRGLFGPSQADSFAANPTKFSGQNLLNGYKLFPNGTPPQGVTLPTPNKPLVPANQSVATLNVQQQHGNANLSLSSPGGNGPQVNYLHYLSSGQGTQSQGSFAGISDVPLRPGHGQPSMVTTGPLNGCAVHALHNPANDTLSFVHQADFSKYGSQTGKQQLENFLKQNELQLVQSLTPNDYSHPTGKHGIQTGATAFAHYDKASEKWNLVGQLNDWKNGGTPGGRPELQRPPGGLAQQLMNPVDLQNPLKLNELK
ncbi:hypothetical protein ATI61_113248 [Archangium gephyra]|uniref:Uncharacterized protein n=1 Tax=Archangium gephyra TaxID=48 RepID=A0AAC8TEK3_9BACT|nr:hypothetical protein [Archangium gephyra]AKJ03060.1 Hypothetical protein AA314_04686 [Archangium gephyra]REG25184.1 hypothetical protein ATI61_113248 [Archangium gephyra]